jgi:hypothetical protein
MRAQGSTGLKKGGASKLAHKMEGRKNIKGYIKKYVSHRSGDFFVLELSLGALSA